MIGMIAAVSANGVIGQDNKIPFDYPADLKHFRGTTLNSIIIMGRKTFEGIGKPLPKRENVVITSQELSITGVRYEKSILNALRNSDIKSNIWLIGGASIYQEGMKYCDGIILTLTPDVIEGDGLVRFPFINPLYFDTGDVSVFEEDERLRFIEYYRKY